MIRISLKNNLFPKLIDLIFVNNCLNVKDAPASSLKETSQRASKREKENSFELLNKVSWKLNLDDLLSLQGSKHV